MKQEVCNVGPPFCKHISCFRLDIQDKIITFNYALKMLESQEEKNDRHFFVIGEALIDSFHISIMCPQ